MLPAAAYMFPYARDLLLFPYLLPQVAESSTMHNSSILASDTGLLVSAARPLQRET
jgi:hypothetical protein